MSYLVHWQSNLSDCPPPPTHPFESSLALKIRMHTSHLRFLPLAAGFWGPPLAPKGPGQILGGGFRGGKAPQQKINLRVLVFLIRNFVILPVTLMKILACKWYIQVILHIGIRARSHEFCSRKYWCESTSFNRFV